MIYDQFGREIPARETRRPDMREIAVQSIRDRWSTYPSNGLTPQRLAGILRAADQGDVLRQAELFEEMEEKDPHMASQFQTRKLAVQGLSWDAIPAGDDSRNVEIARFCSEALSGLDDLDDHILDMLDSIAKGYSMMEIIWDISSRQAAIRQLRWVHPKKITFWESFAPRVLTDEEPARGVDPPAWKFVYHRYKARSGYDTRAGILRVCAWMYLFKNYAIKDWAAFAEVYGMPIRIGKYEPGASKADRDALLTAIRSIGADAAGIVSKATEIEFVESQKSGGAGQNIYESLVGFCDAQMSKAIIGQTLTADAGGEKGQGSYALGRVHDDVRQDLVEADSRALARTITAQIFRPLVGFNFGWDVPVPRFKFFYEPPEDLKAAADMYNVLVGMGQPISREHVAERFKIPLPGRGETPLTRPQSYGPMLSKLMAKRAGKPVDAEEWQSVLDASRTRAAQRAGDAMQARLKPVLDFIDEASSLEEIGERLYRLYPQLDPGEFEDLLARAMFAAALTGAASET